MRKYRSAALLLAVVMAVSAAGCSSSKSKDTPPPQSSQSNLQDVIASDSIEASMLEQTDKHDTVFTLNRIVDSGHRSEDNERFIYLDVTIKNTSDTEYDLNALNNFYILLDDGNEIHFDVRTQLYGQNNVDGYVTNPFKVAPGSELSGLVGGFLLKDEVTSFKVCFFPTGTTGDDKTSVIKVSATSADIVAL
ncbi:MAG: DUF4352 domain-containing protein [Ruminococcus sp.]|nr:DUF4352 domain-containing protein [Ruminococcus sp.]